MTFQLDSLTGLLLVGLPMGFMVIVAFGRPIFASIKHVFGQPEPVAVGTTRYRAGGILVLVAMLVSWIVESFVIPHVATMVEQRVLIGALTDAMVLAGLFVLGGDFWDKLHALFVHDARVVPEPGAIGKPAAEKVEVGARFWVGTALLSCLVLDWGLIPLASVAGWSAAKVASLSGAIFIANKIILVAAVAVMDMPGFNHLKYVVGGFFRKFGPPREVSPHRYLLGLVFFMVPVLITWPASYATGIARPVGVFAFLQEAALEGFLLVGLYLLGGEFWDKVRALFRHRAKVEFSRNAPATARA